MSEDANRTRIIAASSDPERVAPLRGLARAWSAEYLHVCALHIVSEKSAPRLPVGAFSSIPSLIVHRVRPLQTVLSNNQVTTSSETAEAVA